MNSAKTTSPSSSLNNSTDVVSVASQHADTNKSAKRVKSQVEKFKLLFFVVVALLALFIIIKAVLFSYADIFSGLQQLSSYNNLKWAHDEILVQQLTRLFVMLWLVASCFFFGGWLFHRSYRKLTGKQWLLSTKKSKRKRFFPPVVLYLKVSCIYLVIAAIYLYSQYPLQFMCSSC